MTDLTLVQEQAGVTERGFRLTVDGQPVPGLLWSPSGGTGPRPAVLFGHGRTGHKRNPHLVDLARHCVARGWAAVALDPPGLYELLGSTDRRLHAYPGDHGELPGEAMAGSVDFLGRYLPSA
ncbi:MAG: hypothetical protein ACM32E_17350 [Gemmatimonadota bacterium]